MSRDAPRRSARKCSLVRHSQGRAWRDTLDAVSALSAHLTALWERPTMGATFHLGRGISPTYGRHYHLHEPAMQTHGWASSPLEGAPVHQKPLTGFGRAALKRHTRKPPCNSTWWKEVKKDSQRSCLLSLRRAASRRPPPSVVAADCDCTTCREKDRKKKKHLMYCVQQAGCPAISPMEP